MATHLARGLETGVQMRCQRSDSRELSVDPFADRIDAD